MGDGPEKLGDLLANLTHDASHDISQTTSPGAHDAASECEDVQPARNRPRTYPYFTHLPYPVESEATRLQNLDEIIRHLYIAIEAGDLAPGAVHWTRELRSWLGLKFDPTKDQRVKLAKLYYELALAPGIDNATSERFASMFMVLTKRKHYLRPLTDLVLDWRPLFRELKALVLPTDNALALGAFSRRNHRTITKICAFAQLYFDPKERQAMLDEILPYFNTSFIEEAFVVVGLLNLLLPTTAAPPSEEQLQPQKLIPTLFHLWALVNRSRTFDQHFIDLLSRFARDSLSAPHVPLTEFGILTGEQASMVFTAILRILEVPVGQASSPYSSGVDGCQGLAIALERDSRKHPIGHQIARWIVMSLSPACVDKPDSILTKLEALIQAVETFFHPSNVGTWTKLLSQLVYYLSDFFVMRWNREKSGEMDVPTDRRLNAELKRRFVLCLRDVTFMAIYSKSGTAMNFALSTLQSLATLEPELILPAALQRIYPSMQGLVEVHRTASSLRALQILSRVMICTKGYRCHTTALLGLALPGIDANDLDKTLYSLSYMQSVCYNVPFYDLTAGRDDVSGNILAMDWVTAEVLRMEQAGADVQCNYGTELSEHDEDLVLRSSTASFAEFLTSFLGRVFTLLENLPDAARVRSGSPEENVVNTLPAVFTPLLASLSPDLYDLALNKIAEFIANHVVHQARDAMAFICNSLCKVNPEKALKRLIPMLITAIRTEIDENGAGTTRNAGSEVLPRDRGLVWSVSMLGMSVVHSGSAVLAYKDELLAIATYMQDKCQGTPVSHISNFIHHLLLTLTCIYTIDYSQFEPSVYERGPQPSDWGSFPKPGAITIRWHVPSPDEIAFAAELFKSQAKRALPQLQALIDGSSPIKRGGGDKAWSDELARNLVLLRLLLAGISVLFDNTTPAHAKARSEDTEMVDANGTPREEGPDRKAHIGDVDQTGQPDANATDATIDQESNGDVALASGDDSEVRRTFKYIDGYPLKPSDSVYTEVHDLRSRIGEMLHNVHVFLVSKEEDDLTAFQPLYTAYRSWFIDYGIEKSARVLDRVTRLLAADIHAYKISGTRKEYPRALLVRRDGVYHLQRLRYNASPRVASDMERTLLLDLAASSTSAYAELRRAAQSAIESATKVIIASRPLLIPPVLAAYETGIKTMDYAKIKGAMHTLLFTSLVKTIGRDWRYAPRLLQLFLKSCDVDKPSIQRLCTGATVQVVDFCRPGERLVLLDQKAVRPIAPPESEVSSEIEARKRRVLRHRDAVQSRKAEVSEDLVNFTKHAHWKTAARTVPVVITLGFRFESLAPDSLVELCAQGTIDEHPGLRALYSSAFAALFSLTSTRVLCEHSFEKYLMDEFSLPDKIEVTTRREDPGWTKEFLESFSRAETAYYVDAMHPGWLVWAEKMPAHTAEGKPHVPYDEVEQRVVDCLSAQLTREWFRVFFKYLLQEPRDASSDRYRHSPSTMLAQAFGFVHDGHSKVTFAELETEIRSVYDDGNDKHKHRATAEIIGGAIASIENKSLQIRNQVWEFCMSLILPIFKDGLTPENSGYWTTLMHVIFQGRDPRRAWPLMEWLAEFRLDMGSNAAFKESSKITLLNQCIVDAGWHFQLAQPVLEDFLAHLDHPYKGVREAMGGTIAAIYRSSYNESYPDQQSFIKRQNEVSSLGVLPYQPTQLFSETMRTVFQKLAQWREERTPGQTTPSSYTSGSKTVLLWLDSMLSSYECTQLATFIPDLFTEELLHMMDIKEDQELQSLAYHVFRQLSNVPLRIGEDAALISSLIRIGTTSPFWHQRLRVLVNIQSLYFRRLFLMTTAAQQSLFTCVASMLHDQQHEVRQGAMTTLSGMIRCSGTALRTKMVTDLSREFTELLLQNPLPKKTRATGAGSGLGVGTAGAAGALATPSSTGASTPTPEHSRLVLTRHAAVLGLGALVQAFPYTSPPPAWIPAVLATLATKANADPGMVGKSVKTILSDFKKTRQDTWHLDLKAFTEEQLEGLEGVLWKSYFA